MEVKISMYSAVAGEKKQLSIDLKQVSYKAVGDVITASIQSFLAQPNQVTPVVHLGQLTGDASSPKDLMIETMPFDEAVEAVSNISSYPDLVVTTGQEISKVTAEPIGNGGGTVELLPEQPKPVLNASVLQENMKQVLTRKNRKAPKPYQCTKNKNFRSTDLTEKMIETTPILGLRKLVSSTPWLIIPGYSKMQADTLRKKMKQALEEHRKNNK